MDSCIVFKGNSKYIAKEGGPIKMRFVGYDKF